MGGAGGQEQGGRNGGAASEQFHLYFPLWRENYRRSRARGVLPPWSGRRENEVPSPGVCDHKRHLRPEQLRIRVSQPRFAECGRARKRRLQVASSLSSRTSRTPGAVISAAPLGDPESCTSPRKSRGVAEVC